MYLPQWGALRLAETNISLMGLCHLMGLVRPSLCSSDPREEQMSPDVSMCLDVLYYWLEQTFFAIVKCSRVSRSWDRGEVRYRDSLNV